MVVGQLKKNREYLHQYLAALFRKDPHAGATFHDMQVQRCTVFCWSFILGTGWLWHAVRLPRPGVIGFTDVFVLLTNGSTRLRLRCAAGPLDSHVVSISIWIWPPLQVSLYADYDYPQLLPFLRKSNYYNLDMVCAC
jgi:hypothetical protein